MTDNRSQTFGIIADDLSGAAEVAGVAFRFGFPAEVITDASASPLSAVTVLDTDSRSLPAVQAARRVEQASQQLQPPRRLLFKKVDSILRGPVLAELLALLRSTGMRRALLVPANPALGRVVRDGTYLINGVPIDQTDFRNDPDNPVRSSLLSHMLQAPDPGQISVLPPGTRPESAGVCVGEAFQDDHLAHWAEVLDEDTLAAGAAAFLAAVLKARGCAAENCGYIQPDKKILLVSGSASAASRERLQWLRQSRVPACPMPDRLFTGGDEDQIEPWAKKVAKALEASALAVISIDRAVANPSDAARLSRHLAQLIQALLAQCTLDQLWVEGGATASAIVRSFGWTRLEVRGEVAPGVVQLQPGDGPLLIIKPGSYPWPKVLLQSRTSN